jgi:hypothetical protein
VEDVRLAVTGNQIQAAGDADALLVEVDTEDLFARVFSTTRWLFIHRE